jgi:diaminopimelate epimerase
MAQRISFIKMHGLGNDFVIIDLRKASIALSVSLIQAICNRHTGIGCDQLVTIEAASLPGANVLVKFYNADGSESGACGNASRCVAHILMKELQTAQIKLQTTHRILACATSGTEVAVNMGVATLEWKAIPLSKEIDTLHINEAGIKDGVAVNIGNPHLVVQVPDLEGYDVATQGAALEQNFLFPERANINFVQVLDRHRLKLRVWERGAGETLACGSGACATVVAAYKRGWTGHHVTVELPGGTLTINVQDNNMVQMIGPVAYVYEGSFNPESFQ